jgi:antagonist of KipI
MPSLKVIRPGMLTTIQDLGRWGWQGSGVPVAGPMDPYSHRAANRLVDNDDGAAALEITLIGPELEADAEIVCAVAGAPFGLTVDGRRVPMHAPFAMRPGARLRFGARAAGARAALAVRGGFDVDAPFGSRATSLISATGPLGGRPLQAGDVLPVGHRGSHRNWRALRPAANPGVPAHLVVPRGGARLRVIRGPHEQMFTPAAYETLFESRYTVTARSNRMGYRLDGATLQHAGAADVLSDATPLGSIQVPAAGTPILLMADRQTTGGYPRIGTVITADIPLAGQLAPGDWIEFAPCGRAAAIEALKAQRARLNGST